MTKAFTRNTIDLSTWSLGGNNLERKVMELITDTMREVFAREGVDIGLGFARSGDPMEARMPKVSIDVDLPLGDSEQQSTFYRADLEEVLIEWIKANKDDYPSEAEKLKNALTRVLELL